jgi:hypothetical protein
MPLRSWAALFCRILGLGIFVLAFFLPAVRGGAPGSAAPLFRGWQCASVALSDTLALFGKAAKWPPPLDAILVVFSGWINVLLPLMLIFSLSQRFRIFRMILGVIMLLCMAATWTFFIHANVTPLIGHSLWIVGALLIIGAEAFAGKRTKAQDRSVAA